LGLCGPLGIGKTKFAQFLAAAAGIPKTDVTSPTFTLWQTYRLTTNDTDQSASVFETLHHLDLYRVVDADEFWQLGVEECWDVSRSLTVIEWADRFAAELPSHTIWIQMQIDPSVETSKQSSDSDRKIIIECSDATRRSWLDRVVASFDPPK
ncbi:MAG: tRNA (adenosine(37)-N6)-threonylcarbamoyltransferase complex ATPase subunit type 1 TsaE, partial [Planctomycetota bacterium]